jgi:hypothetical protein
MKHAHYTLQLDINDQLDPQTVKELRAFLSSLEQRRQPIHRRVLSWLAGLRFGPPEAWFVG